MTTREIEHALRYATEAAKVHLMDEYKRDYPQYFRDAVMVTRPATNDDYFVPPSLASQCVVVERTGFSEEGCKTFSCFSLKKDWEPCKETDPPQWIYVGEGFELACQNSCRDHDVDSEWTADGRCVMANPLKKAVAAMPEKIFERSSRHMLHGGLNLVEGKLELNPLYCQAYGLEYKDKDCIVPPGQDLGEFLFGSTAIRAAKTVHVNPFTKPFPPLPKYVQFKRPKKRKKRSTASTVQDQPMLKQIAVDVSKDVGLHVTEWAVKRFIQKKCPQLLTRAIQGLSARVVLSHSMKAGLHQLAGMSVTALGTATTVVGAVYAVYDMVTGILDAVDPWDYMKVLDKKKLADIDRQLDYDFFKDGMIRPELTPEFVWHHELLTDSDGRIEFMISKVDEYLDALKQIPPNKYNFKAPQKLDGFFLVEPKNINGILFKCMLVVLVVLSLVLVEWIHFTSCALFFLMLFYQAY